jgi:hypothetical protein
MIAAASSRKVWEPLLPPLLEPEPLLTPTTLLEHLQAQKPGQEWSSLERTLQRRMQHLKSLYGPTPKVMFHLTYQAKRSASAISPRSSGSLSPCGESPFPICCSISAWPGVVGPMAR